MRHIGVKDLSVLADVKEAKVKLHNFAEEPIPADRLTKNTDLAEHVVDRLLAWLPPRRSAGLCEDLPHEPLLGVKSKPRGIDTHVEDGRLTRTAL